MLMPPFRAKVIIYCQLVHQWTFLCSRKVPSWFFFFGFKYHALL